MTEYRRKRKVTSGIKSVIEEDPVGK